MRKLVDLTGKQFGKLTVIKRSIGNKKGTFWDCQCSCGNKVTINASNLKDRHTRSCGCMRKESKSTDLTGLQFGRLTAMKRVPSHYGSGGYLWLCKCTCGKEVLAQAYALRKGRHSSCGCLAIEKAKSRAKHGGARDSGRERLYDIWNAMKGRCSNSKYILYNRYGGRGITVCKEWLGSYIAFREWALSNGYNDNLTIDRINNDGNYEPSNCRWATYKEQALNTSKNFYITYNGITKTLEEWGTEFGIKPNTLRYRIKKHKWSIEKALTTPINEKYRNGRAKRA